MLSSCFIVWDTTEDSRRYIHLKYVTHAVQRFQTSQLISFSQVSAIGENCYSQFTFWKVKPGDCIYTAVQQQPVDKGKKSLSLMVSSWSFLIAIYGTVSGSLLLHQQFPSSLLALIWCYGQQNVQGCYCEISWHGLPRRYMGLQALWNPADTSERENLARKRN